MSNQAAWIMEPKGHPFEVKEAPMPTPGPNEVVIEGRAVTVNPADIAIQKNGILVTKYPMILGCDVAGKITAVGSNVENLVVGDRVIGLGDGALANRPTNCTYQHYCATDQAYVTKLPHNVTYVDGSVIPLALVTAARAMFDKKAMGLPLPQLERVSNRKVFLVWGGASSVGSCAVQMAKAAGYSVATTSSVKNFEYCKGLGADFVFDYTQPDIVDRVSTALRGKQFGGAFDAVVAPDTIVNCAKIASQLGGDKIVGTVLIEPMALPEGLPEDVNVHKVMSTDIPFNEIGQHIWKMWVPHALANGQLQCKPNAEIVGRGLGMIQEACDKFVKGVSASKLVVELP